MQGERLLLPSPIVHLPTQPTNYTCIQTTPYQGGWMPMPDASSQQLEAAFQGPLPDGRRADRVLGGPGPPCCPLRGALPVDTVGCPGASDALSDI